MDHPTDGINGTAAELVIWAEGRYYDITITT